MAGGAGFESYQYAAKHAYQDYCETKPNRETRRSVDESLTKH